MTVPDASLVAPDIVAVSKMLVPIDTVAPSLMAALFAAFRVRVLTLG